MPVVVAQQLFLQLLRLKVQTEAVTAVKLVAMRQRLALAAAVAALAAAPVRLAL